jgi:adenylate cyclase
MERKLTAIFSADVKGYSRLMGDDEEATIRTLTSYRAVMISLIQQHHGRVVDSPGDNLLAEFASAVDAVQGAVEIQHELQRRNMELPDERKMEYRIGINVGDVIIEGERLYGDGVNIAARLEGLAEPGGICISGTVYDQVENKLALGYEYVGEQEVKNITKPVRVYRVKGDGETSPTVGAALRGRPQDGQPHRVAPTTTSNRRVRPVYRWITAGLMLVTVTTVAIRYLSFPRLGTRHSILGTQEAQLPLPDKPSIAVLPFTNMSNDPEQEHFSDGMSDTLITDLSKIGGLFVIARNSTFLYKGKAIKPQQVSQELGVRYVVEGSVQRAAARIRINAQLVDATTGRHLWAERYDRELNSSRDIFTLQDEITQQIVAALQVKLTPGEQGQVERIPTENLEAYDYYLRGMEHWGSLTKDGTLQARRMFEKAVELDPQFALAHTFLGHTYLRELAWHWSQDPQAVDRAFALAQKALALDDSLPVAHNLLGFVYAWKGQPELCLAEGERAIALDPNCSWCYSDLAEMLIIAERPEEALGLVEKAMRLDPHNTAYFSFVSGWAYRSLGRYEEAIAAQKRVLTRNPDHLPAHEHLANIYYELGRTEEARAEETEIRRLSPNYPLEVLRRKASLKGQQEENERLLKHSFTDNLKARAYFFGGAQYFFRWTQEANAQARYMWEQTIELDPQFAAVHALLGFTYAIEWGFQWSQDPQALERALVLARKAIALDDSLPLAHLILANVYLAKKQPERALVEAERAVALDPNSGDNYDTLAGILIATGRSEEAMGVLEKGLRLNPLFPAPLFARLGQAYSALGRYTEALDALQKALPLNPNFLPTHLSLAGIYGELGREEEARAEVAEVLRLSPNYSLEGVRQRIPFKDPAEGERALAALRKAGLE